MPPDLGSGSADAGGGRCRLDPALHGSPRYRHRRTRGGVRLYLAGRPRAEFRDEQYQTDQAEPDADGQESTIVQAHRSQRPIPPIERQHDGVAPRGDQGHLDGNSQSHGDQHQAQHRREDPVRSPHVDRSAATAGQGIGHDVVDDDHDGTVVTGRLQYPAGRRRGLVGDRRQRPPAGDDVHFDFVAGEADADDLAAGELSADLDPVPGLRPATPGTASAASATARAMSSRRTTWSLHPCRSLLLRCLDVDVVHLDVDLNDLEPGHSLDLSDHVAAYGIADVDDALAVPGHNVEVDRGLALPRPRR